VSPAVAQKVLGIGAVDLKTQTTPDYQGVGPAADGRVKPDVQAPTNTETGSGLSDTATQVVGNLVRANGTVDPGTAYAFMIAMGSSASWSAKQGAGLMQLRPGWSWTVAKPTISDLQKLDLRIGVGPNQKVRLAIWWPELPATHNDVDVSLIGPDGHTVWGEGLSVNNVFERVNTVRIHGYAVRSGSQLVNMVAITTP
jgi:hypothetical protein